MPGGETQHSIQRSLKGVSLICLDDIQVAEDPKGPVNTEIDENQGWDNLLF